MSTHTSGPWRVSAASGTLITQDFRHLGIGSGVLIGSAFGHPKSWFYPSDVDAKANARLMAAAPELLEALQACAAHIVWTQPECEKALLQARAAIAKATGSEA